MSRPSRVWLIVVAVAAAHAAFFIAYQRADWDSLWTDQNGYMRLGRVLADTGRFTRYPDSPRFIPEAIRTPGYPAFIALVDRVAGESHVAIAIAQAALFAIVCVLVYVMTLPIAGAGVAFAAALVAALYSPLPYYGALALTEMFTTWLVTMGLVCWLRALETGRTGWYAAAGGLFGWTALTRPTFQFLPLFLVAAAWLVGRGGPSRLWRGSLVMLASVAVVLTPWLAYNYVSFGAFTFTPAGGVGRVLFEGSWQAQLPGRIENTLTNIADQTPDRRELDEKVRRVAAEAGMPPEPMLLYVHQWQDIRKIWTEPQDPLDRTLARIAADREYLRVGLENVARHPASHVWRRIVRGTAILWATEIPVRYSSINDLPPWIIRALWIAQGALIVVALAGLRLVWVRGARAPAAAFAALLVYITAVHVPLYAEARYSLPAKPVVLLLATIAAAQLTQASRDRSSASSRSARPAHHSA